MPRPAFPSAAEAVEAWLIPELTGLAALAPAAAAERRRRMAADAGSFCRGALALHIHWMQRHAGSAAPWVWAAGDPHQGNFATLAVGRADRDGVVHTTFDLADIDDEHPAPWRWDLLRLMASVKIALPDLDREALGGLAAGLLADYERTVGARIEEDAAWSRIDLDGLPEAVKRLIEDGSAPARRERFLRKMVIGRGGDARLRLGEHLVEDHQARAFFGEELERLWAPHDLPRREILDIARRDIWAGLSSIGRRRWLALIRERVGRDRDGAPRVIEIKERRPSALSRVIAISPFPPQAGLPWCITVPMGGDPWQGVVVANSGEYLVRTRCHTRDTLDLPTLDHGDLRRLCRLWGQLIAAFHLRGLDRVGADTNATAEALAHAASNAGDLADQAWGLAGWNGECFGALTNME